ncbi:MAG TPA: CBS domain-containing protein, partial [Bacillota bacterium]|nr:CBS domain-containing protein [Bacillota bacterium]
MDEETRVRLEKMLDDIKALLSAGDSAGLADYAGQQHPADLAEAYSLLSDEDKRSLIRLLPSELAADIVEELDTEDQTELVTEIGTAKASGIIGAMESDDATDLLSELDEEQTEDILKKMGREEAQEFKELLSYEDDSSGGIMGTEYVALTPNMKVDYALDFIRRTGREAQTLNDIYVVDADERLVGVLSLRDIVVANPMLKVSEIMHRKVVKVGVGSDQEEAAQLFKKYG